MSRVRHEDQLLMELQQRRSADSKIVGHAAQAFTLINILEERLGAPKEQDAGAKGGFLSASSGGAFRPIGGKGTDDAKLLEEQERLNWDKQRELEFERQQLLAAQQQAQREEESRRPAKDTKEMSVEEVLAMAQQRNADLRSLVSSRVR